MQLRALRQIIQADWKQTALYGGLIAAATLLLVYQLGTLLPGFSGQEIAVLAQANNVSSLLQNPVNAPYLLLVHALSYLNSDYLLWGRVASTLFGVLTIALFCGLTWYWYGRRNAVLGTILFTTSAWFLHTARLGTPDVLLFMVLALVACYVWLHNRPGNWALLTSFIVLAVALYIPGMVWLVTAGVIWRFKSIDQAFKQHLWAVSAGSLILLGALVPLGIAIYHHPEVAKVLAGLPASGWPQPLHVLHNLISVPYNLFVHGSVAPDRWLGNVPVLDVLTAVMFLLGGYLYLRYLKLKRVQLSIAVLIVGSILVSLGGAVTLTLIVPFVYIVAAAGIGFMIDRWLAIFPRNGLAQGAGYTLVGLAMLSASVYSFTHYFVAWPQAKATRMIYTKHQLPPHSGTINK
jgi:4-amino-4-deoxy-L-arabinose transferase-like glycosyltransferase